MKHFFLNIYKTSEEFSLPKIINLIFINKLKISIIFLVFYSAVIYKIFNTKDSYSTTLEISTYNNLLFDDSIIKWKEKLSVSYNNLFLNHNIFMNDFFFKVKLKSTDFSDNAHIHIRKLHHQLNFLQLRDNNLQIFNNMYSELDNLKKILNHRDIYKLYENYILSELLINKSINELPNSDSAFFDNFDVKIKQSFMVRHDVVNGSYAKLKVLVPAEDIENYKKSISIHINNVDEKMYSDLETLLDNLINSVESYFNLTYDTLEQTKLLSNYIDINEFDEFKSSQNSLINEIKKFSLKKYKKGDLVFKNVANLLVIPNNYNKSPFFILSFILSILLSFTTIIFIEYIRLIIKNEK